MNLFKLFARRRTVAEVLSQFEKTMKELDQISDECCAEETRQLNIAAAAREAANEASREADRALRVRVKLAQLVD